jgi:hypothetical protein
METTPSEWIEHNQAGCVFWVHQSTGEVCVRRPGGEGQGGSGREEEEDEGRVDKKIPVSLATGSLVYESEEYEELMRILG